MRWPRPCWPTGCCNPTAPATSSTSPASCTCCRGPAPRSCTGTATSTPSATRRLIGHDYGGPYLGFVNGDTPQRLLQPEHDGPRNRTSPEVDALAARMQRHRWGNVEPVPTPPESQVDGMHVNTGPIGQHDTR